MKNKYNIGDMFVDRLDNTGPDADTVYLVYIFATRFDQRTKKLQYCIKHLNGDYCDNYWSRDEIEEFMAEGVEHIPVKE